MPDAALGLVAAHPLLELTGKIRAPLRSIGILDLPPVPSLDLFAVAAGRDLFVRGPADAGDLLLVLAFARALLATLLPVGAPLPPILEAFTRGQPAFEPLNESAQSQPEHQAASLFSARLPRDGRSTAMTMPRPGGSAEPRRSRPPPFATPERCASASTLRSRSMMAA